MIKRNGLRVFQEFTGNGSPLGEYLLGNDLIASRKTFGFHGRKDEGCEGNLRTQGGLLYYGYVYPQQHDGIRLSLSRVSRRQSRDYDLG